MILTKDEIIELLRKRPPLVENMIDPNIQIQPAGIDLTVREICSFNSYGKIDFTNNERLIPKYSVIPFNEEGWAFLKQGAYLIKYNEIINMPLNLIAIGKPRSSLLRMGAFIVTAIWDPGYRGRSVSLLLVNNPSGIYVKKNARVLQLIFIKLSKITSSYRGIYQNER